MPSERALRWVLPLLILFAAGLARAQPADLLAAQGIARYQAGDLRGALPLLRQALARAPEHLGAGHHLGLTLIKLGQLGEGRRVLAQLARSAPASAELSLDLGQAYLLEGNHAWAVRSFSRASELAPENARARYLHGLALLRMGEAAAAVPVLRGARGEGVDAEEASLQLGLALYLSRHYEESRAALQPALGGRQPAAARRLLRASLAAEGRPASLLSAEVGVAATVDTNPLYEHETSAPAAAGPSLTALLVLRPWVTSRHSVWGELSAARSFYFPASEAGPASSDDATRDASPSEIRAAASYALRWGGRDPSFEASAGYSFELVFLDGARPETGEPPLPASRPVLADTNHIFLEQHGGHLALQRRGPNGYSQLRYLLLRSQYAELARSNWGNQINFEQGLLLFGGKLRGLGWVSIRHEAANVADYNQVVPGLGLGASALAPLGVVLGLRLGYEHRSHLDSRGGVRWSEQRIDDNLAFTAEASRALPFWDLRVRFVYQRLQNYSTVETYQYSRDLISLGLIWRTP